MPKVSLRALFGAAVTASVLAAGVASASDGLRLSNKWRLEVSEGANSDGVIRFRVTPDGGQSTDIEIPIEDGRGENGVARDNSKARKTQMSTNTADLSSLSL